MTDTAVQDLLVRIATDPALAEEIRDDPTLLTSRFGLSADQVAAVAGTRIDSRAAKPRQLEERLSRSGGTFGTLVAAAAEATDNATADAAPEADAGGEPMTLLPPQAEVAEPDPTPEPEPAPEPGPAPEPPAPDPATEATGAAEPDPAAAEPEPLPAPDTVEKIDMGDGTFTTITTRADGSTQLLEPDGSRTETVTAETGERVEKSYDPTGALTEETRFSADGQSWTILRPDGSYADVRADPGAEASTGTMIDSGAQHLTTTYNGIESASLETTGDGTYQLRYEGTDGKSIVEPVEHRDETGPDGTTIRHFSYANGRADTVTFLTDTGRVVDFDTNARGPEAEAAEAPGEAPNALRALTNAGVDLTPDTPTSGHTVNPDGSWNYFTDDGQGNRVETTVGTDGIGQRIYHHSDGTRTTMFLHQEEDGSLTESRTWKAEWNGPMEDVTVPPPEPEPAPAPPAEPPPTPPQPWDVEVDRHERLVPGGYVETRTYGDGHIEVTEAHTTGQVREWYFPNKHTYDTRPIDAVPGGDSGFMGVFPTKTVTYYFADGRTQTFEVDSTEESNELVSKIFRPERQSVHYANSQPFLPPELVPGHGGD